MRAGVTTATFAILATIAVGCSLGLGENLSGGGDSSDASTTPNDSGTTDSGSSSSSSGSTGSDTGTDAPAAPDPDLVGWWKLDETSGTTAGDSSAFGGNVGMVQGTASWTNAGKRSGAFVFDGATSIEMASHPTMELGSKMTVALWVRVDVDVDDARLFAYGYGFNIKLNNAHPQIEMPAGYWVSKQIVPLGSWHHIAFTFDAGVVNAYYDGFALVAETSTLSPGAGLGAQTTQVKLGSTLDDTYAMKGALDDVRLYKRVLSAQEIDALVK